MSNRSSLKSFPGLFMDYYDYKRCSHGHYGHGEGSKFFSTTASLVFVTVHKYFINIAVAGIRRRSLQQPIKPTPCFRISRLEVRVMVSARLVDIQSTALNLISLFSKYPLYYTYTSIFIILEKNLKKF